MHKSLRPTLLGLLLASTGALAQSEFSGAFQWQAPASVEKGGRVAMTDYDADYLRSWSPVPDWKGAFGAGFGGRLTLLDFENTPLEDRTLYAFRLPLQCSLPYRKTLLLLRLTPALHSDLEEVDGNDFRLNGLLLARYPWRPDLQVGAGLLVGDSTGSYGVMPAAGLRWRASERWTADLFMPRPRLLYKSTPSHAFTLSAGPAGGQWNIGGKGIDDPERDLHYKALQGSLGYEWSGRKNLALSAALGGLFNRTLETDGAPDAELGSKRDLGEAFFLSLGVKYSLGGSRPPF